MGDRCSVSIKFGGTITKAQARELVNRLAGYDALFNGDEAPSLDNLDEQFWMEEVNYGQIEDVTDWCQIHGVAYDKWNDAGGGYGAATERHVDGKTMTCPSDKEADALVPLHEVLRAEALASCLADLITTAKFMCGPFPNLVIEGE